MGRRSFSPYMPASRRIGITKRQLVGLINEDGLNLNDRAYWRNVPAAVWNYKLGGYQVLKKWLSYRDHKVLHRPLHPQEVQHFTNTARRIAAILGLVGGD